MSQVAEAPFINEKVAELFETARQVKQAIYGPRLVMFAPLYISSLCANDCELGQ